MLRRVLSGRLPLVVSIALLIPVGIGIELAQSEARRSLERRFHTRVELAARFASRFASDIIDRERRVAMELMTGDVTPERFRDTLLALGLEAGVLLDHQGRLITGYPHRADLVGVDLASQYEHLRTAVSGVPAVSSAVPSAALGRALVAFAAPFDSPSGRRVFSGGHYLSTGVLAAFLEDALPFRDGRVMIIDKNGVVASSNRDADVNRQVSSLDPALWAAVSRGGDGTYSSGGRKSYFSAEEVEGARWTLVATVPAAALYQPVSGTVRAVPWLILLALGVAGLIAAGAVSRMMRARSQLESANKELARANALVNEFVAVASHDLRGPLTAVSGFAQILESHWNDFPDADRLQMIGDIQRSTTQMKRLTDDLLAVTALEAKGGQVDPEPVDLERIVREVIDDYAPNAPVDARVAPGTVAVADPLHVRRILGNYLSNALKYGAPPIAVRAEPVNGFVEVRVMDEGEGVPPELQGDLFEKFGSASRKMHSNEQSTGLGLAIVKGLAEANGGSVWYEHGEENKSLFGVRLPAAPA